MSRKIFLLLVVVASFCCVAEGRPVNKSIAISWGDIDIRYSIHSQPAVEGKTIATLRGWRGERVSAVAEIWSSDTLKGASYEISELKCCNKVIPFSFCESGYVTYQMADELGPDGHGCGSRKDHSKFDSLLVSDCIDKHIKCIDVLPQRIQPLWISFDIPLEAIPGVYFGTVDLKSGGKILNKLRIQLTVEDHELPRPHDWRFHLDLWQNPYAVSRYENVPLWGDAHFDAMRPVFTRLADAGQKVITASIIHKPWNGQVYDPYMSMVRWTKKLDGTWDYGYDVFDRWVEFMMSLGIDKQINCYSMVPWRLSFQYYDEASNTTKEIKTKPGEKAYEELWIGMLKNFAAHLKSKG